MNGVGNQLLACTGFTPDQDRGVPFGDQAGLIEYTAHHGRTPNHVFKAELMAHGSPQQIALFARAGAMIGALKIPTAITQEGGYNVDMIGTLLERFLHGWASA